MTLPPTFSISSRTWPNSLKRHASFSALTTGPSSDSLAALASAAADGHGFRAGRGGRVCQGLAGTAPKLKAAMCATWLLRRRSWLTY
jgi:hypothetical protein